MRTKKYEANTLPEALREIRRDLGPDAVIVHTEEIRSGVLGLFGKPRLQVIAAPRPARATAGGRALAAPSRAAPTAIRPAVTGVSPRPASSPPASPRPGEDTALRDVQQAVREIKGAVSLLAAQQGLAAGVIPAGVVVPGEMTELGQRLPPTLVHVHDHLLDQEVSPELARGLVDELNQHLSLQALADPRTVVEALRMRLERRFPVSGPLRPRPGEPTVLFLIGPTGVGKTTTIAKLAANLILERSRVALVTCDTFRVAAIPQLTTYGDIMGVPVGVAYTPAELTNHVLDHLDKDFIIIDTPGRSQHNHDRLAELQAFVQAVPSRTVLMTVSATARYRDTVDVIKRFGVIPFDGLVVTKIDETTTFGPLVNLAHQVRKPLSYLTVGQNVPADIELATPTRLAGLVLDGRTPADRGTLEVSRGRSS